MTARRWVALGCIVAGVWLLIVGVVYGRLAGDPAGPADGVVRCDARGCLVQSEHTP